MKIGLYLKELRLKNNLTTKQVEVKTGISNSYISLIERNKRKPSAEILNKLAKAYQAKAEDLLRLIGYLPSIKTKYSFQQIPIYNIATTKKPFLISENIEGYSLLPPGLESYSTKDFFAIRVKDKSMTCKRIEEGDILIIRKQSDVENGTIALISFNNEIALKRITKQNKYVILQNTNLEHSPILVKETDDFNIIGKVEWVIHKF
ncbi:LexA family transcriptional regulator [bacterium]|nr:helix-turn-helix domain-containing protein [Candidatus Atribacteria bacterium]MBU1035717.1 LexA family transcriptional regulator [bacterium]MBU4563019.1 LexA family transcriptional regulator [bacterium]